MPRLQAVHPVLPVRDVERAVRYYVDRLGFSLAFRDPSDPNGYAGVRRGDVELHLQWHAEEDFVGVEAGTMMLRLLVDDPDALFAEYLERFTPELIAPGSVFSPGSAPSCSPGLGPAARADTDPDENPRRHPQSTQA